MHSFSYKLDFIAYLYLVSIILVPIIYFIIQDSFLDVIKTPMLKRYKN